MRLRVNRLEGPSGEELEQELIPIEDIISSELGVPLEGIVCNTHKRASRMRVSPLAFEVDGDGSESLDHQRTRSKARHKIDLDGTSMGLGSAVDYLYL